MRPPIWQARHRRRQSPGVVRKSNYTRVPIKLYHHHSLFVRMENRSQPPTGCIFCLHIYPSAISILMRRWWLTWECVVVTTTCAIIVAVATERRIEGADDVSHALRGHSALEYSRTLSNENCSSMFDECFFAVFDVHSIDDATIATMRWIIDEYGCPVLVAPTTWADSLIHAHIRQTHSEHTGDQWRAMSRLHIFFVQLSEQRMTKLQS